MIVHTAHPGSDERPNPVETTVGNVIRTLETVRGPDYRPGFVSKIPGEEIVEGGEGVFLRDHSETWGQAVDDWTLWMRGRNLSRHTIRQWRWLLRNLGETYLRRSPWRLTTEDLYRWYGSQDSWSANTRKNARSAVCSFYSWAHDSGRVKHDPAVKLPGVRTRVGLPRPASEEAIAHALDGASDKIRLMILLGAKAGLRCTEMASLRWADVGDEWMIVRGKGDRERPVPVHKDLRAALRAERRLRMMGRHGTGFRYPRGGDTWVFPGQSGGHMSARWVSQQLSAALGDGITAHMLRHRAATAALERTGNLGAVQELLGHASPATTRIYSRVGDAALIAAVSAL